MKVPYGMTYGMERLGPYAPGQWIVNDDEDSVWERLQEKWYE